MRGRGPWRLPAGITSDATATQCIPRARGGFTLLEVLVGLTVASIAITAGVLALGAVQDRTEHAEAASVAAISGATQRALLVEWLAGARTRATTGERFEGMQNDEGGRLVHRLVLPTTARTPLGVTSSVVGLYIDTDPETPERGLVAELSGAVFGGEIRRMELVPEAGVLYVRYLTDVDGLPVWDDTWSGRNRLPRLIEITLEAARGESLPPLLQFPIRVALGGGL
jgi:prepilin-type N-terminal cleavage/methylation domain-containing protein